MLFHVRRLAVRPPDARSLASQPVPGRGAVVPIVCLAFVFFSVHEHFRVPALLAKKTMSMLLAYATGAVADTAP